MTYPFRFAHAALMLTALSLSTATQANLARTFASTFDSGLEGWTGLGCTVSHAADGYLQQLDTQR